MIRTSHNSFRGSVCLRPGVALFLSLFPYTLLFSSSNPSSLSSCKRRHITAKFCRKKSLWSEFRTSQNKCRELRLRGEMRMRHTQPSFTHLERLQMTDHKILEQSSRGQSICNLNFNKSAV